MQVKHTLLAGATILACVVLLILNAQHSNGDSSNTETETPAATPQAVAPPVQIERDTKGGRIVHVDEPDAIYRAELGVPQPAVDDAMEFPIVRRASEHMSATFEVWINENTILPREQLLVRAAIEDARLNWLNQRQDASRSRSHDLIDDEEYRRILSGDDAKKALKDELIELVGDEAVEALEDIGFDLLIEVPLK
jgi:hypothetical protein